MQIQAKEAKIYLVKRWDVSKKEKTLDLDKTSFFKQTASRAYAFEKVRKLINEDKIRFVLSDSCLPGKEIEATHGWTFEALKKESRKDHYDKILTHPIPKLKALYQDKISAKCIDNQKFILLQFEAFKKVQYFLGFYEKLKKIDPHDVKKIEELKKQITDSQVILERFDEPKKILEGVIRQEAMVIVHYAQKRNQDLLKEVLKNRHHSQIVFISPPHSLHMESILVESGIQFEKIEIPNFPRELEQIIYNIFKQIEK